VESTGTREGGVGDDRSSLDDSRVVVRYGVIQSRNDAVSKKHFSLTDKDKEEAQETGWARYSVFEDSLTSPQEAVEILPPKRRIAIRLPVGLVNSIRAKDERSYDVVWDWMPECLGEHGLKIEGAKLGCEGHCGIHILHYPNNLKMNIARSKIIDMVNDQELYEVLDFTFEDQAEQTPAPADDA